MVLLKFTILLFLFQASAYAQIVDEFEQEASDQGSVNNPLSRDNVNLGAIQKAFNDSDPKDSVYFCHYKKDAICKIRTREYMNTLIVLPNSERIDTFDLGDTSNFEFVPILKNGVNTHIASLRNYNPGADTTLNIVSDQGYIYSFYVRVDDVNSVFVPDVKVYINNPASKIEPKPIAASDKNNEKPTIDVNDKEDSENEYLRRLENIDLSKLELNKYKGVSGDKGLLPMDVFDDGTWTYFRYSTENLDQISRVPAIYKVVDGIDTPINTRVVNGTIIAESVSTGWTLRSGQAHLCIRHKEHKKPTPASPEPELSLDTNGANN